jgi:hypothetical protein
VSWDVDLPGRHSGAGQDEIQCRFGLVFRCPGYHEAMNQFAILYEDRFTRDA